MSTSTNNVTITDNTGLLKSIVGNGIIVVTTGETHESFIGVNQKANVWTLSLGSDRKGSSSVAESFIKSVDGLGSHMFAAGESGGDTPDDLNFYFGVTLTTSTNSEVTVNLGQGNSGFSNNWWFASLNVFNNGGSPIPFNLGGQNVALTGSTSAFEFSNIS